MIGINKLAVVTMRAEPSDKSEIVNQILFGETFDILEENEKWSKVKLKHDQYTGWIDKKQWGKSDQHQQTTNVVKELFQQIINNNGIIYAPMGSYVEKKKLNKQSIKNSVLHDAKLFLETPYLWGGRTFMGIDCSGFTQVVFRANGINLMRDACQQAEQGETIQFENIRNEDLGFFQNKEQKIIHVGILFKEDKKLKIIHASGKVRIDLLDEKGIFNEETQSYTHNFHSVKRVIK
jgi:cell wall-associated NlpC family hydrolase